MIGIIPTGLAGVIIFEPKIFRDERGCFFESFNAADFEAATGIRTRFVQDNESVSRYGVVRGLHYQRAPHAQSKIVRVVSGRILDIAVDLRQARPPSAVMSPSSCRPTTGVSSSSRAASPTASPRSAPRPSCSTSATRRTSPRRRAA